MKLLVGPHGAGKLSKMSVVNVTDECYVLGTTVKIGKLYISLSFRLCVLLSVQYIGLRLYADKCFVCGDAIRDRVSCTSRDQSFLLIGRSLVAKEDCSDRKSQFYIGTEIK